MRNNNFGGGGFPQQGGSNGYTPIYKSFFSNPIMVIAELLFLGYVGLPAVLGLFFGYVPENAGLIQGLSQTLGLAGHRAAKETIQTTGPLVKSAQESINKSMKEVEFTPSTIDELNKDVE